MKNFDKQNDDEMSKFSWTGMFAVTSACSFIFYLFLFFIEGEHISLFLTIGGIALVLALIAYMNNHYNRKNARKRAERMSSFSIFQED